MSELTGAQVPADGLAPLPTVVIGGYLGAGKTTLVNHLLRHAGGRRIAVLVNDFGEVDIDADLIVGQDGEVLSLAGGCVCCSFGSDLVGTLMALPERSPPPEVVLIELSGVALPAAVVRSARLAPGIDVVGTLVVLDAADVARQAADRYVGDTVRQQLADADLLLLNKTDLVDAAALPALRHALQALARGPPGCRAPWPSCRWNWCWVGAMTRPAMRRAMTARARPRQASPRLRRAPLRQPPGQPQRGAPRPCSPPATRRFPRAPTWRRWAAHWCSPAWACCGPRPWRWMRPGKASCCRWWARAGASRRQGLRARAGWW